MRKLLEILGILGILVLTGSREVRANYIFTPTSGNLVVGSTVAVTTATAASIEGVNIGSWRGTLTDDNFHWVVAASNSGTTGVDVQLNVNNVSLNGANTLTVQTELDLDATTPITLVQICDWSSSTGVDNAADAQCTGGGWRTLNNRGVGISLVASSGTNNQFMWQIYDGYFSGAGATGPTAVSTPLANFVNGSSSNQVKVRYYSRTSTTSQVSIDFLRIIAVVNPIYTASAMTNLGSGATTGVYGNTTAIFQGTQGAVDQTYAGAAGTAGSVADMSFTFGNVDTYYGMNVILLRATYSISAVGTSVMPAILNVSTGTTGAWENLSTTATGLGNTANVTNAWAKNNITIANYINASNQIKIRFYGTNNSTSAIRLDQLYITLGTTNSNTNQCEISFGSGTQSFCSYTQDLDMTGVGNSWNITAEDENTARSGNTAYYPGDTDGDAGASEEASAGHVKFKVTRPNGASITGMFFAGRYMSGAAGTVLLQARDYSGTAGLDGGFLTMGATATTSMVYTDNVTIGTVAATGGMAGYLSTAENFQNTVDQEMWLRLKTSVDGGSGSNSIMQWDFAMVSMSWTEDGSHFAKTFQFTPTSGNLVVGGTVAVTSQTVAAAEGINVGSWKAALADDNFHWVVTASNSGTTGLNAQLNIDNVQKNGANSMLIQSEFDLDATVPVSLVQICDWSSSTGVDNAADAQCTGGGWRTINNRNVGVTGASPTTYFWQIYDGYWANTTPLGNFINSTTAANSVKIRFFATTSTTSQFSIDYLRISTQVNPVYPASAFTNLGVGATTGSYRNTTTYGQGAIDATYSGAAGTAGSIADFYYSFNNVVANPGANTILVRATYSCSATGINLKPKIYNFNSSAWEDLTATAIPCATADATNAWAKNNVTISNYISSGQIRVGFYGSGNATTTIRVDMIYVMLGATNTDTANCEISMGTGTATTCDATRNLDMTTTLGVGMTFNFANIDEGTTGSQNTVYAFNWDMDATVEEAAAANIGVSLDVPTSYVAYPVSMYYSARFTSGYVTPRNAKMVLRDYSGAMQATGGFMDIGATSATGNGTFVYTDPIAVNTGIAYTGWAGITNNANHLINVDTKVARLALVTSVDPTTARNTSKSWDFGMVAVAWIAPATSVYGTIYNEYDGFTAYDCSSTNLTLKMKVNGSATNNTTCTENTGTYSIVDVGSTTSGDVFAIYLSGESSKANLVTRTAGNLTLVDQDLIINNVVLDHEDAGPITNTNLSLWDSASDSDVRFTISSGNLVGVGTVYFTVGVGATYQPGGNVSANILRTNGTFNLQTNTLNVWGEGNQSGCSDGLATPAPFCVYSTGNVSVASGTVNYWAGAGAVNVPIYSTTYNNLGVGTSAESGSAASFVLGGNVGVGGTLTIGNASSTNSDTLDASSYTLTLYQIGTPLNVTSKGIFTPSTSTVNYEGQGATNLTALNYYNLGVGTSSESGAGRTYTLAGGIGVTGVLSIGNSNSTNTDVLDGSSYTIALTGQGTPFVISSKGSFTPNASTVKYLSAGGLGTTISVATSGGDGVILQPTWTFDNTSTTINLTVDLSDSPVDYSFHRFQLASAIDAGTSIADARIQLYATAIGDSATTVSIYATKSANAPQPSSGADRPGVGTSITSAYGTWNAYDGWSTSQYNTSTDISNVIQELVDAYGGLAANSYITIWLHGNGGTVVYPTYNTYDDAGATEPRLSLKYGSTENQKATATTYYNLETSARNSNGTIILGTASSQNIVVSNNWVIGNGTTVTIVNGGTYNPGIGVTGNVTANAGTTLTATSGNLTIGGSWSEAGTYIHNNGTVIFNDASKVSLLSYSGSGIGTTLYNLSVLSAGKTLALDNVDQTTIANNFTVTGTSCTGAGPVYLRSDTPTDQFEIKVLGTASVSYADVKNSNAINAITANNSVNSGNNTNWTINAGVCSGNTNPNSPTALAQRKTDDTNLVVGSWHNASSIKFTASVSDADASETLYLCVEKKALGVAFTDTEDSCGTGVSAVAAGVGVTATVTISSITDATEYHWQARTKDNSGAYSAWVQFGANAESARDFGIDTTAPTGGTVYDGDQVGVDLSYNDGSLSTLNANWASFNSNVSGLLSYEYSVGTGVGLSDVVVWTGNGTSTSVTVGSLTLSTNNKYYFNLRANDNAGNVSTVVSSNGINIAPTLVFTVSPTTATLSNLNATNNYTATTDTTITTSTNAYNGYVIRAYLTGLLTSTNSLYTVINYNGGSYASPDGWQTGDRGFGYNSSDTSVQGSNIFNSTPCPGGNSPPCFSPFSLTAPGDIVADHTSVVSGTPINNESFTIGYKVQTDPTQQAANYTTTVIYTVIPQY